MKKLLSVALLALSVMSCKLNPLHECYTSFDVDSLVYEKAEVFKRQVDTAISLGRESNQISWTLIALMKRKNDTIAMLRKSIKIKHATIVNIGQTGGQSAVQISNYNTQNN